MAQVGRLLEVTRRARPGGGSGMLALSLCGGELGSSLAEQHSLCVALWLLSQLLNFFSSFSSEKECARTLTKLN